MTADDAKRGAQRADDIAYLTALVRAWDRPRYYATLFAPGSLRADLFALYGFAAEIARIPDQVSDPTLGEVRLQWWSDALHAVASHEAAGETPALRAIGDVLRKHSLPEAPLGGLIEARSQDFYADPPATIADLEGYFGETESALFQMAAIICGSSGPETADAAGHAGVAYGLTRRLAVLAADRARGRTIVPTELLSKEGVSASDLFTPEPEENAQRAIAALVSVARDHLRSARKHAARLQREKQIPFLALVAVKPFLDRIERLESAVFHRPAEVPHVASLTWIAWARLAGIHA